MDKEKNVPAKELQARAEKLLSASVATRATYEEAIPLIFALADKAKSISNYAKILKALAESLSSRAADYAVDHATALDSPLATVKTDIESGEVTIDGTLYRLTISPDEPKRIDGGNMTQDFLKSLPKEWTAAKLSLKKSAVASVSADELEKHNLRREKKRVWSLPDDIPASAE